jgi:hypothetical protein
VPEPDHDRECIYHHAYRVTHAQPTASTMQDALQQQQDVVEAEDISGPAPLTVLTVSVRPGRASVCRPMVMVCGHCRCPAARPGRTSPHSMHSMADSRVLPCACCVRCAPVVVHRRAPASPPQTSKS